ncbi:serine/threonine protein kinase [Myxococcota bacterium]|nr:serine/threonine protein kinase [Myxococcota bacterium]MBU1537148.1 serine/threonine protein kinase [Myxococcota bacterium]
MTHFSSLLKKNPRIGTKYTLLQLVNTGARGAVFKGEDDNGGSVAIKILLDSKAGTFDEEKRHFLAGSTLCLGLEHPNLVKTLDCGEDTQWGPFQVMEYLRGSSLSSRLKGKETLPEKTILAIGSQLAMVIDYIHGMGMLHGDIKPENLFLSVDGESFTVKLMDFLPKRRLKDWMDLDLTPEYLAPEIFAGKQPGPALDHFALGVLLFEITFGKLPSFRNNGSLAIPREKATTSEELIKILRGLLSFKPQRRAETLAQLVLKHFSNESALADDEVSEKIEFHPKPSSTVSHFSHYLQNLKLAMIDSDPLPRLLISKTGRILFKNETASHLLGNEKEWDYFGKSPLAFSVPLLLSDIQDAFELVKVTSRTVLLDETPTTCWTVPIVMEGEVAAVQIILSYSQPL